MPVIICRHAFRADADFCRLAHITTIFIYQVSRPPPAFVTFFTAFRLKNSLDYQAVVELHCLLMPIKLVDVATFAIYVYRAIYSYRAEPSASRQRLMMDISSSTAPSTGLYRRLCTITDIYHYILRDGHDVRHKIISTHKAASATSPFTPCASTDISPPTKCPCHFY